MEQMLFETWIDNGEHHTLPFNDMVSAISFVRDFIGEHKKWGEWENNNTDNSIISLATNGESKYYLKLSYIVKQS